MKESIKPISYWDMKWKYIMRESYPCINSDSMIKLDGAANWIPVSYTHLDVYKRQPKLCAPGSGELRGQQLYLQGGDHGQHAFRGQQLLDAGSPGRLFGGQGRRLYGDAGGF